MRQGGNFYTFINEIDATELNLYLVCHLLMPLELVSACSNCVFCKIFFLMFNSLTNSARHVYCNFALNLFSMSCYVKTNEMQDL